MLGNCPKRNPARQHAHETAQHYGTATHHTSVVLEVEEDTVGSLPGLGLPNDDGGVDLLAELGLALLDRGHDHVADTAGRHSVETGTDTLDGDDVQVSGAGVVGTVHDSTAVPPLVDILEAR